MSTARLVSKRLKNVSDRPACPENLCDVPSPRPGGYKCGVLLPESLEQGRESRIRCNRDGGSVADMAQKPVESGVDPIHSACGALLANEDLGIAESSLDRRYSVGQSGDGTGEAPSSLSASVRKRCARSEVRVAGPSPGGKRSKMPRTIAAWTQGSASLRISMNRSRVVPK
jgi:hypothetical protein